MAVEVHCGRDGAGRPATVDEIEIGLGLFGALFVMISFRSPKSV